MDDTYRIYIWNSRYGRNIVGSVSEVSVTWISRMRRHHLWIGCVALYHILAHYRLHTEQQGWTTPRNTVVGCSVYRCRMGIRFLGSVAIAFAAR